MYIYIYTYVVLLFASCGNSRRVKIYHIPSVHSSRGPLTQAARCSDPPVSIYGPDQDSPSLSSTKATFPAVAA